MRVYYAPRIMQALVINIQQIGKEASKMHLEDMDALSLRSSEQVKASFLRGQASVLTYISNQLSQTFSMPFPSDSCENLMQKLKSVLLQKEDFFLIKTIECSLNDLYRLQSDTEKIISKHEQGLQNEGRLKLRRLKLNIKLLKSESQSSQKDFLSQMFTDFFGTSVNNRVTQYISALQEELKEAKTPNKQEFNFIESNQVFESNFLENLQEYDDRPEFTRNSSMNTQEMIELRFQKQQRRLIKEKEWEKHQILLMKERCQIKKKKIKAKELEQTEIQNHLKKKNLEIEKERQELDRLKNNYYKEKERIKNCHDIKSRKISDAINELASTVDLTETYGKISPITETDAISDISYISDSDASFDNSSINETDLNQLQKRIVEIETLYKVENNPQIQDRLRKELDSLKNSHSMLRSQNILKSSSNSQRKFNSFRNLTLNDNALRSSLPASISSIPYVATSTPKSRASLNLNYRSGPKSNTATPKSTSIQFKFDEIMPKEKQEEDLELRKFLRVQEVRLKEKEERIEKERVGLIEKLKKLPYADDAIPFLKKEIFEFQRKNQELEKKLKEVENREYLIESRESRLARGEQELEIKNKEIQEIKIRLEDEKASVIQTLGKLKESFDR